MYMFKKEIDVDGHPTILTKGDAFTANTTVHLEQERTLEEGDIITITEIKPHFDATLIEFVIEGKPGKIETLTQSRFESLLEEDYIWKGSSA